MVNNSEDNESKRPNPRDVRLSFRVDEELAQKARKKARREKRSLSGIIRSFLSLWANDDVPEGFPPELPDESERAQKRPRKK